MCHSWLAWSLASPTGIGTSWQWYMHILFVWSLPIFVSPTVSFHDITAKGVDNPQCLGVVHKLMHTRILICAPTLALAAEELFKWILANPSAEEYLHIRDCEDILHQLNERVGWRKRILYISKACMNRHIIIHHDILVILSPSSVSWLSSILFFSTLVNPSRAATLASHLLR